MANDIFHLVMMNKITLGALGTLKAALVLMREPAGQSNMNVEFLT